MRLASKNAAAARVVWYYASNRCDYHRMSSLFDGNLSGTWLDALNGISKHILGTDSAATDMPYVRSRQLNHIQEALIFPDETPLFEGELGLGPNPRKVKQDVKTLWYLVLLGKYVIEQSAKRDRMPASGADKESKTGEERPSHLWGGTYPIIYDVVKGFDYPTYAKIRHEAMVYIVDASSFV
ncbi:hypothetical protein HK104_002081 [Borealophlyctis nickersoniae]|nr:hypothetical protein HK104_002081 [Borealophlyctis nickersoniae]